MVRKRTVQSTATDWNKPTCSLAAADNVLILNSSLGSTDTVQTVKSVVKNTRCLADSIDNEGFSSLADKLAPLDSVRPLTFDARSSSGQGMGSKLSGVVRYGSPMVSYSSTVVTMTNNMSAIRRHGSLAAGQARLDSSHLKLLELINNVHKSERQITSVFESVKNSSKDTAPSQSPHRREPVQWLQDAAGGSEYVG